MQLIDFRVVRDRLILEDRPEINDLIKSSLAGATVNLETEFQTTFDKGSAVDLFRFPPAHRVVDGFYQFKLRNGFVRASPAPVVATGGSTDSFSGSIFGSCILDAERGRLHVPESAAAVYLRVGYDYGFATQSEVPPWLREVISCYAIKVMSVHQVNDRKDELSKVYAFMDQHINTLVNQHLRYFSYATLAIGA